MKRFIPSLRFSFCSDPRLKELTQSTVDRVALMIKQKNFEMAKKCQQELIDMKTGHYANYHYPNRFSDVSTLAYCSS